MAGAVFGIAARTDLCSGPVVSLPQIPGVLRITLIANVWDKDRRATVPPADSPAKFGVLPAVLPSRWYTGGIPRTEAAGFAKIFRRISSVAFRNVQQESLQAVPTTYGNAEKCVSVEYRESPCVGRLW